MNESLEHLYFTWLCAKVSRILPGGKLTQSQTNFTLLRRLHHTEFIWLLSGDDNRAEDGKELRYHFTIEADMPDDPEWRMFDGCSVLEMLVAFAKRAEFQTDIPAREWFWEFMDNLGLGEFTDAYNPTDEEIDEKLEPFIWRTYHSTGVGGLFPLEDPKTDQRKVELWYQFFAYITDHDRVA